MLSDTSSAAVVHSPSNTLGLSLTKLHQDHSLIGREVL